MFEKMRERWTKAITPLVHRMEGVDPSTLTWTSLALSLVAFYLLMGAERNTEGAAYIIGGVVIVLVAGKTETVRRFYISSFVDCPEKMARDRKSVV